MTRLAVVLVHGVGDQQPDWADPIARQLERDVLAQLAHLLPSVPDPKEVLAIQDVYWADILQERQRELYKVLAKANQVEVSGSWWRKLVREAIRGFKRVESRFVAEFIGDVIGYLDRDTQAAVHKRVTEALDRLSGEAGSQKAKTPLTIVAHSLGTVISSNYVYDHAKRRHALGKSGFDDELALENFFTIGSPLALFSLQYGGPQAFKQPIKVETVRGRWINISDKDDPVGMPLKSLNDAYGEAVFMDVRVNSGVYLLAHTAYFQEPVTMKLLSRKLALDWVAHHHAVEASRLASWYDEYDQTLGTV